MVSGAPTAAGAAAAWRTPGRDDPAALTRERLRQGLAAGGLAGGVAGLLITILSFGTIVVLHRQSSAPSAEAHMLVLLFGPMLGMTLGLGGGSIQALRQPKPAAQGPLVLGPAPDSSVI